MKITSFNPLIVSKNAEEIVKLFQNLGFESNHEISGITTNNLTNYDLKDADGHVIDVATATQLPQDFTIIRMNVDNFDEAYELLTSHGFTNQGGNQIVETETSKSALMTSPSGFAFDLCQHFNKG